jgi:hypothetical protein
MNGGTFGDSRQCFGVLSGTAVSTGLMESFLQQARVESGATLQRALTLAVDAWSIGYMALGDAGARELPTKEALAAERQTYLRERGIEAALLERSGRMAIRYRELTEKELQSIRTE